MDRLVQERRNSSVSAMDLRLSLTHRYAQHWYTAAYILMAYCSLLLLNQDEIDMN